MFPSSLLKRVVARRGVNSTTFFLSKLRPFKTSTFKFENLCNKMRVYYVYYGCCGSCGCCGCCGSCGCCEIRVKNGWQSLCHLSTTVPQPSRGAKQRKLPLSKMPKTPACSCRKMRFHRGQALLVFS